MSSTAKASKDKPHGGAQRLAPRPTAASMARAAHNAANRSLADATVRQSPSRTSHSPSSSKGRDSPFRNVVVASAHVSDSKMKIKAPAPPEPDTNISEFENETVIISDDRNNEDIEIEENKAEMKFTEFAEQGFEQSLLPTEGVESRPSTPKHSGKQSRIPGPHTGSRPSTPRALTQRASRPVTPQPKPPKRSETPNTSPEPVARSVSPKKDNDIKSTYNSKRARFIRMKKELDLKQQAVMDEYECLKGLREQMVQDGISDGDDIKRDDLVIFNVGDWSLEEVAQLCHDAAAASKTDGVENVINTIATINESALEEVKKNVLNVPERFANLCLQAISARQEMIDWVKEIVQNTEHGGGESIDRIADYNQQGFELCESLRNVKLIANETVDYVSHLLTGSCKERNVLLNVAESLVREVAKLREEFQHMRRPGDKHTQSEIEKQLEETRRELEEERAAKVAVKDKGLTTESQLKQARGRITKLDRQLKEAEASIVSLTATVKTLEDQNRQREVQLEAKARKLRETLKTGEVTSIHLAQQRDILQAEVLDLKDQLLIMVEKHKEELKNVNGQMKELKAKLEEEKQATQNEIELKRQVEQALTESQQNIEELKAQITHLENSLPNPEIPTEREMELWAELQATKETLRTTEDEVTSCKREKIRFLETLTKIADSENKVGMQQKLAAELLNKEEIVGKMQCQIRELSKNLKLNEQKVVQYEQYVRDLRLHNQALVDGQDAAHAGNFEEMQQEMMAMRMSLLEAEHRNEELTEVLMQREQQLDQQDKTSRAQARVIKIREELINMLKNKETEQSRELSALQHDLEHRMKIVDEVNHQIAAKADEIQELFSTLESKQQQIHRLEKIVLALEEQQRRAQAQRTRQEEKIAALEHELATAGGGCQRRDKKFLFF